VSTLQNTLESKVSYTCMCISLTRGAVNCHVQIRHYYVGTCTW